MKLQTKILFALLMVVSTSALAKNVNGKEGDVMKFAPAAETTKPAVDSQDQLTVREELADEQLEGGSCQLACHPAFTVFQKTNLSHFDTTQIK